MVKALAVAVGVIVVLLGGLWVYAQMSASSPLPSDTASSTPAGQSPLGGAVATSSTITNTNASSTTSMDTITQATLHTNMGDITIKFLPQQAPNTVANFIKLASSGYYDGTKFHRVIKGFMDQGGDPLTKDDSKEALWGTGGPGYTFNDEITASNSNIAGAVAMANSGPNTNGSQFFINAVNNPSLNQGYTVFANVTAGMDVVTKINNVPTDSSDRPLSPVVLTSMTLK